MKKTALLVIALLAIGVAGRLVPHLPNATPLAAIALLSSQYIGKRWSLILPLVALFMTDLFIGFYDWRIMGSVYVSVVISSVIIWSARKRSASTIGLALLLSTISFFLITNGAVWYFSPWYEKSLPGLLYAYEMGLPFLRNMFLGDIFYSAVLMLLIPFFLNIKIYMSKIKILIIQKIVPR